MSTTISGTMAREKYLLTTSDLKQLSKPPLLEEVQRLAVAKHGSLERLNEEVAKKAEERQTKKRKRDEQKAAALADAAANQKQRLTLLRAGLEGQRCEPDVIEWLMHTPEAQTWARGKGTADVSNVQALTAQLLTFRTEAANRRQGLLATLRRRLIQQERQLLKESWVGFKVTVSLPCSDSAGLCVKLEPRNVDPVGVFVTGFTRNAAQEVGPLERCGKVQAGDVIVGVNGIGGTWQTVLMALSTVHQIAQGKPQGTTVPVELRVMHFQSAPAEVVLAAEARALEPVRLAKASSSPLVDRYARATHTINAEIWLFDPSSVANEILLPIERLATLRSLFQPHELDVAELPDNALRLISVAADSSVAARLSTIASGLVLFGSCGVGTVLRKFVDDGEVGRGRNKTALNQAKQVVRAVVADFKAAVGAAASCAEELPRATTTAVGPGDADVHDAKRAKIGGLGAAEA